MPKGKLDDLLSELVLSNHILANEDVLDGFGHVSARHPERPDRFLISRARSPDHVCLDDILKFTLDGTLVTPVETDVYSERIIHGAIYAARPDIHAVCHNHADAIMPFCVGEMKLVPVFHLGATMGRKVPVWDSREEFGDTNLLVATKEEGDSLARALGPHFVILLRRHGAVVAGHALRELVFRAIYMRVNAEIQFKANSLGGYDRLSPGEIELAGEFNLRPRVVNRSWERWVGRLGRRDS